MHARCATGWALGFHRLAAIGVAALCLGRATDAAAAELVLAEGGRTTATVIVSPSAGKWERQAAEDLALYFERMSGAKPALVSTAEAIPAALAGPGPKLIVGQQALALDPALAQRLAQAAKPKPELRADAIALVRQGDRILLAGTNDDSHYYAVAALLQRFGCRWYYPTEFGECIPRRAKLAVDALDHVYGSPFEVRRYWLSWNGDNAGRAEFMRRNFFNEEVVPSGHVLAKYTKDLVPPGKSMFNIPISEPETAAHVAQQLAAKFAQGERIMLGLEDGIYTSDSKRDQELQANLVDKYFLTPSLTDAFLEFYNQTSRELLKQHPQSTSKIGFLAYSNITIPPQREIVAEKPLVAYLAPIDIDPIHGIGDTRSLPKREYAAMLARWSEVMQGRVVIYDYDQTMLVWRDIPAPSVQAFRQDVAAYRRAGILGVDTESRGAMATIHLNLFYRGQLLWNPEVDVDALEAEFYTNFYGPAAAAMQQYGKIIDTAWKETICTEHEYFVIPAIYTPDVVTKLAQQLAAAQALLAASGDGDTSSATAQYRARLEFIALGQTVLESYTAMIQAANGECDYAVAVAAGERGLAAREKLTEMNGTFTTYKKIGERGPAWWPGEVEQYRQLAKLTDGSAGKLIAKLPLEWLYRRDPHNSGIVERWSIAPVDLSFWNATPAPRTWQTHQANPGHWEAVRSDLYLQAQGVLHPDFAPYQGLGWYRTDVDLPADQVAGPVHIRFPGLFNECWLYVNGYLVAHRPQKAMWWFNDYRFEWDVDLTGKLRAGKNTIAVRIDNPHHLGGMFRRPFLYRAGN